MNQQPAFYFTAIIFAALAGGFGPLWLGIIRKRITIFLNLSSGILLGAAFLLLIPEADEVLGPDASLPILLGFLVLFLLEKFFFIHPCEEVECATHSVGVPAFLGISFHALTDGLALGAGLVVPGIGIVILLALVFHKMPAAFSLSSILLAAHYTKKQIVGLVVIFSLMTPLGALFALYGLNRLETEFLGWALGLSAGSFLAIATSDILGHTGQKEENRMLSLLALLLGVAIAAFGRMFHSG
jgi:zinc and cadmium transporter